MEGWSPDDVLKLVCNPFYAIEIDPNLASPHDPLQSQAEWVAANVKLIQEVGAEKWLNTLLDVLSGGYLTAGGPGPRPSGPFGGGPPLNRRERRRRK